MFSHQTNLYYDAIVAEYDKVEFVKKNSKRYIYTWHTSCFSSTQQILHPHQ